MVDVEVIFGYGVYGSYYVSSIAWNFLGIFCGDRFLLLSSASLPTPVISKSPVVQPLWSMKIIFFGSFQDISITQAMAVSGIGEVYQVLLMILFLVNNHKLEFPLFISTWSKENGTFGPWYLTAPGIFMLMHL